MRVAVLFSGGKDSTYATYLAKKAWHEIRFLVSVVPETRESYMFHFVNILLTKIQAKRMGINHLLVHTKAEKEKELADLERALRLLDIEGVVSGAVASEYQKKRVDEICAKLGLESIAPLWHQDPERMLKEQLALGFKTVITSVSAEGLDESWLGRELDEKCIADLKKLKIHLSGEGGEYCTTVLNCPLFSSPIIVKKSRKVWEKDRGYLEITAAG